MILCGHRPGEAIRKDVVNNNTIYTLLSDYQFVGQGGNGLLRIMTFSPKDNKIYVKTYSPYLNQYETRSSSQFTLDYNMVNYTEIGTNYGVVNGSYTTVTWNNLDNNTKYYWYVRAVDSNSQIGESEIWKFVSGFIIPVSIPGDINNDGDVDVGDLAMIAVHFGKTRSHPRWNETANLVADNEVDVYDIVYVASRFT